MKHTAYTPWMAAAIFALTTAGCITETSRSTNDPNEEHRPATVGETVGGNPGDIRPNQQFVDHGGQKIIVTGDAVEAARLDAHRAGVLTNEQDRIIAVKPVGSPFLQSTTGGPIGAVKATGERVSPLGPGEPAPVDYVKPSELQGR